MSTRLLRLPVAVVGLVSGTYFFVYLVRWEWQRASIAALVFLASEVLLATWMVLDRLNLLETRMERSADPLVTARIAASRPPARVSFAWLDPTKGRAPVLVPVLLGAGVLLSGLAFVIERLARATASPVAERGLARSLSALALPPGGLLPTPGAADQPSRPSAAPRRNGAIGAVLLVLLLTAAVIGLREQLETRPDQEVPAVTVLQLRVHGQRTPLGTEQLAQALWWSCRTTVKPGTDVDLDVLPGAAGTVRVTLTPGLGTFASRRLRGCLGDLRIERLRATDVVVLETAARGG